MDITWGAQERVFNQSIAAGRGLTGGKFMAICVLFMGYDYENAREKKC